MKNQNKMLDLIQNPKQGHKDFIISRRFHASFDAESGHAKLFPSAIT